MNTILGAIIEAWEEVKINRIRVILSLIGVGAAVWAMATVIALGVLLESSVKNEISHWAGVQGTISLGISTQESDDLMYEQPSPDALTESSEPSYDQMMSDNKKVHQAAKDMADRLDIKYWTTYQAYYVSMDAPEFNLDTNPDYVTPDPALIGIDPGYFQIYGRILLQGRFLQEYDEALQMNPVVINETLWEVIGRPDVHTYPRIWVGKNHSTSATVVGVIQNFNPYDQPEMFSLYANIPYLLSPEEESQYGAFPLPELRVVAPVGQEKDAEKVTSSVLQAYLGPGYSVTTFDNGGSAGVDNISGFVTGIVGGIGGIVILLGALGLLTVSIVTIKTRVREIGIRRAVGASAQRIFFSVFLESVVATTAAGFFGVIASIFTIRFAPLNELLDLNLSSTQAIAYPFQAAFLGLLISAGVGALCGIIPATIAVKMRPIDAIRF